MNPNLKAAYHYGCKLAEDYYHGTTKELPFLRAGSYVTPYLEDALSFGIPWSSSDLDGALLEELKKSIEGRPPTHLKFKKGMEPEDSPLYVYKIPNSTKGLPVLSNMGGDYPWNRAVSEDTPIELVESFRSWKDQQSRVEKQLVADKTKD